MYCCHTYSYDRPWKVRANYPPFSLKIEVTFSTTEKVVQTDITKLTICRKNYLIIIWAFFFQSRQNLIELLPDFMNLYKWPLNRRHQSLCKLCTCSAWSALTERFIAKENYIRSNKLRWTGPIFDRAIKNVRIYSVIDNIMFPQCRISTFTLLSRQSHSRISCTRVVKKAIWLNHRVLPW